MLTFDLEPLAADDDGDADDHDVRHAHDDGGHGQGAAGGKFPIPLRWTACYLAVPMCTCAHPCSSLIPPLLVLSQEMQKQQATMQGGSGFDLAETLWVFCATALSEPTARLTLSWALLAGSECHPVLTLPILSALLFSSAGFTSGPAASGAAAKKAVKTK